MDVIYQNIYFILVMPDLKYSNYFQIVIVDADGDTESAVLAARDVYVLIQPLFAGAGMYTWIEESGIGPPSALKRSFLRNLFWTSFTSANRKREIGKLGTC
jgi:hypothetical protein